MSSNDFVNMTPRASQDNEAKVKEDKIRNFKFWFVGIVGVCAAVIIGSAIFYYQYDQNMQEKKAQQKLEQQQQLLQSEVDKS